MTSQLFFICNVVLAILFAIWYFWSRKSLATKPTKLNLREQLLKHHKSHPPVARSRERDLSIQFVFNGHNYDSYEVLGAPAGAPISVVTDLYQKIIASASPTEFPFYEAAFQAVLARTRS